MAKSQAHTQNYFEYIIFAMAIALPLHKKLVPILIGVAVLGAIFNIKNHSFRELNLKKLALPLFFILHAVGLLYSDNLKYGGFDLETKLSFLIFPLIILSCRDYSSGFLPKLKLAFLIGCCTAIFVCLINSTYLFLNEMDTSVFFYTELSIFHHPTYMALYVLFALLIAFEIFIRTRKYALLGLITFLMLFLFLLSSRMGILFGFVFAIYTGIFLFKKKILKRKVLLGMSIVTLILIGGMSQLDVVKYRIDATYRRIFENTDTQEPRKALWKSSFHVIKKNPVFGVGTGDVKDILISTYQDLGYEKHAKAKSNPHNQYLQTTVALGLVGFLCLLASFIMPLLSSIRSRSISGSFLIVGLMIFSITESILETQSGIAFFSFSYAIFLIPFKAEKHE